MYDKVVLHAKEIRSISMILGKIDIFTFPSQVSRFCYCLDLFQCLTYKFQFDYVANTDVQ